MSQWPRLAWAYEEHMRKNERTWAFIEIKYVRHQLNKRIAKLQRAWRDKQYKRDFEKFMKEHNEKQEKMFQAAGNIHTVMFNLFNMRDYMSRQ